GTSHDRVSQPFCRHSSYFYRRCSCSPLSSARHWPNLLSAPQVRCSFHRQMVGTSREVSWRQQTRGPTTICSSETVPPAHTGFWNGFPVRRTSSGAPTAPI